MIQLSHEPEETAEDVVARLLQASPGEPCCAACLAFALDVSLVEAREMMARLELKSPRLRRAPASCASCGRTIETLLWMTA